ncbi:MAG: YegS/Rv2252/BmrU family lipid kinase [Wenzhouxiangellaceae bacterium]|nr:YegS/Rv2252/BmrU family lipid kinase [Wenzhouxiangellaceae bacterium]
MSATTLLLVNPASRSGNQALDPVRSVLAELGPVDFHTPASPDRLAELIRERGPDSARIVLGGGDGTINAALGALLECGRPLGILPLGTANDFARSLDLPRNPQRAARVIARGETLAVDVARVNDCPCVNAFGIGFGPETTRQVDAASKLQFGITAYLLGVFRTLRRQPAFEARIECDGRSLTGRFFQITVANGVHYGGGMTIAHDAQLDNGQLDAVLVPHRNRLLLLPNALAFRQGHTRAVPDVIHLRGASVEIETESAMDVTVDGEFLTTTPVRASVRRRALTVYAPGLGSDGGAAAQD